MLEVLERKAKAKNFDIQKFETTIQDFLPDRKWEMALCVFTVILYLTDERQLDRACDVLARSLEKNGLLLIDIPYRDIFQGFVVDGEDFKRMVEVTPLYDDTYEYHEKSLFVSEGKQRLYEEKFHIRYWPYKKVEERLRRRGFVPEREEIANIFRGSGSRYTLWRKRDSL
jgi:SAM-dependent methyltransferase